jgi:hypothetical protein
MDNISGLFKKENMGQLILVILFIIYLIIGYPIPEMVAEPVDSIFGKIIIFIVVIYLFFNANPVLAVLSLFVAFDLIRRSSITTGKDAMNKFLPSEEKKNCELSAFNFTPYNQFPYTLEQEMVNKMVPKVNNGSVITPPTYKPKLENLHDASNIKN